MLNTLFLGGVKVKHNFCFFTIITYHDKQNVARGGTTVSIPVCEFFTQSLLCRMALFPDFTGIDLTSSTLRSQRLMILSLTQVHKSLSLTQYTMNNPPYLVYISEIICGISLSGFFGGKDSVPGNSTLQPCMFLIDIADTHYAAHVDFLC